MSLPSSYYKHRQVCERKVAYTNRKRAEQALKWLSRNKPGGYRGEIYHCQHCGQYHVGRKDRVVRQDRRKVERRAGLLSDGQ